MLVLPPKAREAELGDALAEANADLPLVKSVVEVQEVPSYNSVAAFLFGSQPKAIPAV